jgi:outer membrane protein, heavy metal efflux system
MMLSPTLTIFKTSGLRISYTNVGVGHPLSRLNASEFAYHGFGVSQELPFPGKLGLASEEAKREAEAEQQNYRAVVLDVTARLAALRSPR